MSSTNIISVQRLTLGRSNRFVVELKIRKVTRDLKYPEGIKVNMSLIDTKQNCIRLLIDNHAPYGFHIHYRLPEEHAYRETLSVSNYKEAADYFISIAERIADEEE